MQHVLVRDLRACKLLIEALIFIDRNIALLTCPNGFICQFAHSREEAVSCKDRQLPHLSEPPKAKKDKRNPQREREHPH